MSDTPRTDDQIGYAGSTMSAIRIEFARQLERELAAANERIQRLEEAGDAVLKTRSCGCPYGESVFYCRTCVSAWDAWEEAKEDKP